MEIVGSVAFTEVRQTYLRDHPVERAHQANTNRDGVENLERAHLLFGRWFRVRLSRVEVLEVVLPWHLSEGGEYELVPRSGLTVGQTVERLRSGWARIVKANPVCTAKIEFLQQSPLTTVYLSTQPVSHADYADLRIRNGLFHVDGLHRMLAWELGQRLPREERLHAFIAGHIRGLRVLDAKSKADVETQHVQTGCRQT
jgi:uncharacterized protein DUF6309